MLAISEIRQLVRLTREVNALLAFPVSHTVVNNGKYTEYTGQI